MHRRIRAVSLLTLAALTLTACKSSSNNVQLSGAGSSFVYPVMTRWIQDFSQSHPSVQINYQSIGSGGGVQQVKSHTVDFGASDAALTDDQLKDCFRSSRFPRPPAQSALPTTWLNCRSRSSFRRNRSPESFSEP